ncbi:MAG: dUTP diphosphatase [Pseudomonadota bacterium]
MLNELEIPLMQLPHAVAAPLYASAGAAGADLYAALPEGDPITLDPSGFTAVPTGVAIALPDGWEGQVRPRSGLARRHGVTTLNAPGTVDWDYRGEIQVVLINHGHTPFLVERGMRIAQLVICPVARATWIETASLDETQRGADGFGSTGLGDAAKSE